MPLPPPSSRETGFYFALAQVGLEMVAPIGIGALLDAYLGWTPWGIVGGCIVGFAGGMLHLVVMLQQHEAEQRRQPPGDKP